MRARLGGARRDRRAGADVPRGGARPAARERRSAPGEILPSKAVMLVNIARVAAAAVPVPAGRRSRDRDRVGEEPADRADGLRGVARRRASRRSRRISWRASTASTSGARRRRGGSTSRTSSSARSRSSRRTTTRARAFRERFARVHGRRVPGREPAPADAARPVARRARRARRSSATTTSRSTGSRARRRATCSTCRRRFPHGDRRPARDELPLDAGGPRAREPARAAARGRREGAARRRGRPARRRWCSRSTGPRRPHSSSSACASCASDGRAARRDRDPLPHERALGRLRAGVHRGGDPVPGSRGRVPHAPGRAADQGAAQDLAVRRRRGEHPRGGIARGTPRGAAEGARRAGAGAPGRSGAARRPRGALRRRRADGGGLLRRSRGALRPGCDGAGAASSCSPTTGRRGSSSRRCSCRGSRRRSSRSARPRSPRRSPRSAGSSTSGSRARSAAST